MQNTAQVDRKIKNKSDHHAESWFEVYSAGSSRQCADQALTNFSINSLSESDALAHEAPNESEEHACLIKRDDCSIYLVDSLKQRIKTSTFLQSTYASNGYLTECATTFTCNPSQFTFEAIREQQLLGTLTLTIDSDQGLLADALYKKEIDDLRMKNNKVCEISKFALIKNSGSKEILAKLFHVAYIYAAFLHDATDAVVEVNPRHASFYKRMLGFRQVGAEPRTCQRVNAPAVLLHLEREYVDEQLAFVEDAEKYYEKTIYPYFLSRNEEKKLKQEISCM